MILSGVQTPNCIRATAVDALGLDYRCVVLSDASGAKSQVVHDYNLEDMRCMGIATQSVKEWGSSLQ